MDENDFSKYSISTDILFNPLQLIDFQTIIDSSDKKWQNFSISEVNNSVIRIGIIKGEFHWHKHDSEDEFFYVIEGLLIIEFGEKTLELKPKQAITIPKGVLHKTSAPLKTVILMVEGNSVIPTGN